MAFDWVMFLLIFGVSLMGGLLACAYLKGAISRLYAVSFLVGLFMYSGVGGAFSAVSPYYLLVYFVFFFVFIYSYIFFYGAFRVIGIKLAQYLEEDKSDPPNRRAFGLIILTYLVVLLMGLVIPEFKLNNLISPPTVNLEAVFMGGLGNTEVGTGEKILGYIKLLLQPFFYISLYFYRKRLVVIVMLIALLPYVQFAKDAYVGRGTIISALIFFALIVWHTRPEYRKLVAVVGISAIPLVLVLAYQYSFIRLGRTGMNIGFLDAIGSLMDQEISFPREVGMKIIESAKQVNLQSYFTWIFTLPIPKLLTGPIHGAMINDEITTLVTGASPGDKGYSVVLAGLIGESIYVYGKVYFWVHAISVAFLASMFATILGSVKRFTFLAIFVALMFAYDLNRAGISAILSYLINGLLSFNVYILYIFIVRHPSIRPKLLKYIN